MATVALPRTLPAPLEWGLPERVGAAVSRVARRLARWQRDEARADVWASYAALAVAGAAVGALAILGIV